MAVIMVVVVAMALANLSAMAVAVAVAVLSGMGLPVVFDVDENLTVGVPKVHCVIPYVQSCNFWPMPLDFIFESTNSISARCNSRMSGSRICIGRQC
jgi:hypothetical protein